MVESFDWAVIGAGPAGIAAVGKLIDAGINPHKILWMDPEFSVGDFGKYWQAVSSNTRVGLFQQFLLACDTFAYQARPHHFELDSIDPATTCELRLMAEPLQWVSDQLAKTVKSIRASATALTLVNQRWEIQTETKTYFARNTILAVGAKPLTLKHPGKKVISVYSALSPTKLKNEIASNDSIAVFGASHTAVIVLANLVKADAHKIINLYQGPMKYAIYLENEILFDDTGLKGFAAQWSKQNIDGVLPQNLQRVCTSDPHCSDILANCNKVIYAIGFEPRNHPILTQYPNARYNNHNGIIAPGLFGLGIAYPEAKINRFNSIEYRVGLWKFMDYLNRILPIWMKYVN